MWGQLNLFWQYWRTRFHVLQCFATSCGGSNISLHVHTEISGVFITFSVNRIVGQFFAIISTCRISLTSDRPKNKMTKSWPYKLHSLHNGWSPFHILHCVSIYLVGLVNTYRNVWYNNVYCDWDCGRYRAIIAIMSPVEPRSPVVIWKNKCQMSRHFSRIKTGVLS